MQKKIAIIGAGWTGIGCSRILLEQGYEVDVYEKNDDVGGTWHPINRYLDLGLQSPMKQAEYFDFPLPSNFDRSERILSPQIYDYLCNYCKAKKIYDHITFNSTVTKVAYNSQSKKSSIFYLNTLTKENLRSEYDYVVYTHGYTNRNIPHVLKMDQFSGSILHSFDVTETTLKSIIRSNKKVTIIGGSKAATDIVLCFYKYGYKFKWLYRKNYWFLRFNTTSNMVKRRVQGKKDNPIFKFIIILGITLSGRLPKVQYWIWRFFNIIDTYGKKHIDFTKFHMDLLDDCQLKKLKKINEEYGIEGKISSFENNGINLKDGRFIESDIVIFCTGSLATQLNIELEKDNIPFPVDTITDVYRSKIIPQIPNLIFTFYQAFSLGCVNGLNQGKWILNYIKMNPSEDYLLANATHFDKPFFIREIGGKSEGRIVMFGKNLEPFFKSGELNQKEFMRWVFFEFLFNGNGAKPLDFNMPSNFKKPEIQDQT